MTKNFWNVLQFIITFILGGGGMTTFFRLLYSMYFGPPIFSYLFL